MNQSKVRVLVAEDHAIAKKIAVTILEALNCDVDTANDGREALDLFNKNTYHLILVDIGLPHVNGFELVREIRKIQSDLKKLPIVALTAHQDHAYKKRCIDLGMNECLAKPLTTETARMLLNQYL